MAKRISFAEVSCPLKHETKRTKREALGQKESAYVARGYSVSISNDAINFGETDSMAVFDSTCVNCTKHDLHIVCMKDVRVSAQYIEDICFFEVNTKYISSSELKTSKSL